MTPDGKTLITAGVRQLEEGGNPTFTVTGWELATGKKLGEYTEASGFGPGFIAAAADNKSVVAVLPKGGVAVIDCTTGKKTARTRSRTAGPAVCATRGEPGRQDGGDPARQRLWAQPRAARWCWSISSRARRSRR